MSRDFEIVHSEDVTRQEDGYNCGAFVIQFARLIMSTGAKPNADALGGVTSHTSEEMRLAMQLALVPLIGQAPPLVGEWWEHPEQPLTKGESRPVEQDEQARKKALAQIHEALEKDNAEPIKLTSVQQCKMAKLAKVVVSLASDNEDWATVGGGSVTFTVEGEAFTRPVSWDGKRWMTTLTTKFPQQVSVVVKGKVHPPAEFTEVVKSETGFKLDPGATKDIRLEFPAKEPRRLHLKFLIDDETENEEVEEDRTGFVDPSPRTPRSRSCSTAAPTSCRRRSRPTAPSLTTATAKPACGSPFATAARRRSSPTPRRRATWPGTRTPSPARRRCFSTTPRTKGDPARGLLFAHGCLDPGATQGQLELPRRAPQLDQGEGPRADRSVQGQRAPGQRGRAPRVRAEVAAAALLDERPRDRARRVPDARKPRLRPLHGLLYEGSVKPKNSYPPPGEAKGQHKGLRLFEGLEGLSPVCPYDYDYTTERTKITKKKRVKVITKHNIKGAAKMRKGARASNIPTTNPHEDFIHIFQDMYGKAVKDPHDMEDKGKREAAVKNKGHYKKPPMDGWAQNFCDGIRHHRSEKTTILTNAMVDEIMEMYLPDQLPVMHGLARNYAVSDLWFCSVPSQTNTNRAFWASGHSAGICKNDWRPAIKYGYASDKMPEGNDQNGIPFRRSLFDVLDDFGHSWKYYYSVPYPPALRKRDGWKFSNYYYFESMFPQFEKNDKLTDLDAFKSDAQNGTLPRVSYIEPTWGGGKKWDATSPMDRAVGNEFHPVQDMVCGEFFVKEIYDAVVNGPKADTTVLIITFDENGGTYDHFPPWAAIKPDRAGKLPKGEEFGFEYDCFGVRVPTLLFPNTSSRDHLPVQHRGPPRSHLGDLHGARMARRAPRRVEARRACRQRTELRWCAAR